MTTEIVNNIRKRDIYLLSYDKSGSKHLYLKYCKMRNLVQWDVKSQNKYIYIIYIYIHIKNASKNMGATQCSVF